MAAVAALLSLCFGALSPCPSGAGPQCIGEFAKGPVSPRHIAVSHDDTLIAVASVLSGLHVYNVSTGDAVTVPSYTIAEFPAFSPDGDKVAVSLSYAGVGVINLNNGTERWLSTSHGSSECIAYSPDGKRVASGHSNGVIRIWDADTGKLVLSLFIYGHNRRVGGLPYTLDGKRIISGSADTKVIVWNATSGDMITTLADHTFQVDTIQVSADGLYFMSLSSLSIDPVHIYKLSDYSIHKKLRNPFSYKLTIWNVGFSQDWSKMALVGSSDMQVYSVNTGNVLETYTRQSASTSAVLFFHTSDTIVTAKRGDSASILLWNGVAPTPPPTPVPATDPLLAPCPNGTGPQCRGELAMVSGNAHHIAVSHDDTLVALGSWRGLHVYNVTTGAALSVPSYHTRGLFDIAFSPNGDKVAVALFTGGVAVVSLSSGTELWWDAWKEECVSVAYSPDGTRVASGHVDGNIYIWDAETGASVLSLTGGHTDRVGSLAYTIDGARLISGGRDHVIAVWDATAGAVLKTLADGTTGYDLTYTYSTQVSPDGLYFANLAKLGSTSTIMMYKLSDYSVYKNITVRKEDLSDMSFSPDWSLLVVVGDGDMEVYSVETGKSLRGHTMPDRTTTAVSYFHTSNTVVTGGKNTNASVLLWNEIMPATPAPPTLPRVCTQDAACRVFGDGTANCTSSQHCACGTHSGALCEIPVAAPAPTGVQMSVGITLQVPCERAGSEALLDTLRAEATARGARNVSAGASCGTLSVALSGVVPGATVAATADALVDALGAAAVAHSDLTNVTHASQLDPFVQTAQTSGRNTTAVCTQDALSTVHTYDGRCLVISCNDGFALSVETRDGKDYHTCTRVPVDTPVPPPTSTPSPATPAPDTAVPAPDAGYDGLSAGAIAGIVVGCVVAVAVLAIVLVWWVRRVRGAQKEHHQVKPRCDSEPAGCVTPDAGQP